MRFVPFFPVALCVLVPAVAHADTYTLTSGSTELLFSIPATAPPSYAFSLYGFEFDGVTVQSKGQTFLEDVFFYKLDVGGGLALYNDAGSLPNQDGVEPLINQAGPMLYTLDGAYPSLLSGMYFLTDRNTPSIYSSDFSLSVATGTGVTPEPATVALVGTGSISLLGILRRRRVL